MLCVCMHVHTNVCKQKEGLNRSPGIRWHEAVIERYNSMGQIFNPRSLNLEKVLLGQ